MGVLILTIVYVLAREVMEIRSRIAPRAEHRGDAIL